MSDERKKEPPHPAVVLPVAVAGDAAVVLRPVGLWETRSMPHPHLFEAGRQAAQLAQIKALLRQAAQPLRQRQPQPPHAPGFGPVAA
jgi:hypothetical protein